MFGKYRNKETERYDFEKPVDGVTALEMALNRFEEIQPDIRQGALDRMVDEILLLRFEETQKQECAGYDPKTFKRIPQKDKKKREIYGLNYFKMENFLYGLFYFVWKYYKVKCSKSFIEEIANSGDKIDRGFAEWAKNPENLIGRRFAEKESFLPPELDTEAARKYFPRAIEAGFMEVDGAGCKWKYGGNKGKVRLGYFLSKVYNPPRPLSAIETYFAVKDISTSISEAENAYKYGRKMRVDVKKWRDEIDKAVFYD